MEKLIFILSVLPVIVGLKLYDIFRRKWETATGRKREKYSIIWHAVGWFTIFANTVIIAAILLTVTQSVKVGLLVAAITWIIYDAVWNLGNGQKWNYIGDGHGSSFEKLCTWLGKKIFDARFWHWFLKIVFLVISISIAYGRY